jgi:hypothetical protein
MSAKTLSYIYLSLLPILVTILAFTTGHTQPKIYIPVWLLNVALMALAGWSLGGSAFRSDDRHRRYLAAAGAFLILPIVFLSMLFGMGPPPGTIQEWVATAVEQKVRFDAILAGGIATVLGLSLLKLVLNERDEKFYTQLGYTAIVIAIPLFFIVTAFWHSFALQAYKTRLENNTPQPWYAPAAQQIWIITIGEILLTYFAIALFAGSLRQTKILRPTPALLYILFSAFAIVSILLFPLYPGSAPFDGFPYYPFMIPAMPFTVGYYLGVNLLRKAGAPK